MPEIIAGIGLLISAGSAVDSQQRGKSAKNRAEDAEKIRRDELIAQRNIAKAKQRREARIKSARLRATAASQGVGGSSVESTLTGIESTLEGNLEAIDSSTGRQLQQFSNATQNVSNQADAAFAQSIGSFVGDALDFAGDFDTSGSPPNLKGVKNPVVVGGENL